MSYTEAIGILEEARKQFKFQPKVIFYPSDIK